VIDVVVVSDVRLYRDGLEEMLAGRDTLEVVGTASSGRQALQVIGPLAPDVVLLNVALEDGLRLARLIGKEFRDVQMIALAVPDDASDVIAWAEAGAAGFVTVEQSLQDLVAAIEGVARGEVLCSPRLTGALLRHVGALACTVDHDDPAVRLTAREAEVAVLIERGLSNREIAGELFIEVTTVKNHVHQILEKLEVRRRTDVGARMRTSYAGLKN
jgi:two-component system nitrate/nitrite response regulator NarL